MAAADELLATKCCGCWTCRCWTWRWTLVGSLKRTSDTAINWELHRIMRRAARMIKLLLLALVLLLLLL
jgi:hypothetical protein